MVAEVVISVDLGHWWHKSSGRTAVVIGRSRPGEAPNLDPLDSFPILLGGGSRSVVERIFPWATARVDVEFLDTMEAEWYDNSLCAHGVHDSETGPYFDATASYDSSSYYDEDAQAAYWEAAGEVGHYRYALELNGLGRAFLRISTFLGPD